MEELHSQEEGQPENEEAIVHFVKDHKELYK